MKRIFLATALAFSCFLGTAAAGTTPSNATLSRTGDSDCAKARKAGRTCKLVFDGDTVDGQRVGGDGDVVDVAKGVDFGTLIRVRTSFRDLIIKAAHDV